MAARVKDNTVRVKSEAASTGPPGATMSVDDMILSLSNKHPEGLTNQTIMTELAAVGQDKWVLAINRLLASGKLSLFQNGTDLVYKTAVKDVKTKGLNPEELLVYQVIKQAGNTGVWTKDMKIRTNLAQPQITKILKALEGRHLIKSVKNVNNPSRKLYMLAELEPSREITGGAW
eukprot:jgi/Chrzof1/361/Cz01g13040.t1